MIKFFKTFSKFFWNFLNFVRKIYFLGVYFEKFQENWTKFGIFWKFFNFWLKILVSFRNFEFLVLLEGILCWFFCFVFCSQKNQFFLVFCKKSKCKKMATILPSIKTIKLQSPHDAEAMKSANLVTSSYSALFRYVLNCYELFG